MITIALSIPTGQILSANDRTHWAGKARLVAAIRQRTVVAWRIAGSPHLDRAHLTVTVTYPDRRVRDVHNLMPTVKAAVDGAVHPGPGIRGILPDDSDDYLTGPDLRHDGYTPGEYTFRFAFEVI